MRHAMNASFARGWMLVTGLLLACGPCRATALLAEAGTGPEIVPLGNISAVEFSRSDDKAFFYQHAVALTAVLLQPANGCVVCLAPAALQSITRP